MTLDDFLKNRDTVFKRRNSFSEAGSNLIKVFLNNPKALKDNIICWNSVKNIKNVA